MKPSKYNHRENLLKEVQDALERQRLARSSHDDTSTVNDPLGSLVSELMLYFANNHAQSHDAEVSVRDVTTPIPLLEVAAYFDGTLDDEEKCKEVTAAAMSDPGVMMEIVAGVLNHQQQPTSISSNLRNRLLTIHSTAREEATPIDDAKATVDEVASQSEPSAETTNGSMAILGGESIGNHTSVRRSATARSMVRFVAGLTCAAAVLVVVGLSIRTALAILGGSPDVAQERSIDHGRDLVDSNPSNKDQMEYVPPQSRSGELLPGSTIVQGSSKLAFPAMAASDREMVKDVLQPATSDILSPERTRMGNTNDINPTNPMVPNRSSSVASTEKIVGSETEPSPQPLLANWSEIHGLLVVQEESMDQSNLSSGSSRLRSIQETATTMLAPSTTDAIVRYRTLPLSRASAKLVGKAEFVMSADTAIEFRSDGSIRLNHGEFMLASREIPVDFRITLGRRTLDCRAEQNASLVVRKTINGLEMDMVGAPVTVDGNAFDVARIAIDERELAVAKIADAPERLPKWTTTNVDRIEVGRNVLAQLATSDDLQQAMLQALASGVVRGNSAVLLRRWLVAMSSDDLMWLIRSDDPMLRDAVFQHLSVVGPKDSRHGWLWRNLQGRSTNPRFFQTIQSYFADVWSGQRPDQQRREALLAMFQSPDAADRATANYLLQTFYGPGPRFDLQLSPIAQARAVALWRTRMIRFD